eukprot:scaffold11370_cov129-Isochrysis_galbana.AAC.6
MPDVFDEVVDGADGRDRVGRGRARRRPQLLQGVECREREGLRKRPKRGSLGVAQMGILFEARPCNTIRDQLPQPVLRRSAQPQPGAAPHSRQRLPCRHLHVHRW